MHRQARPTPVTPKQRSKARPRPGAWFCTTSVGSTEKAVHSTMIPASRETELLPKPSRKELSAVSSCFRR